MLNDVSFVQWELSRFVLCLQVKTISLIFSFIIIRDFLKNYKFLQI